ncbi:MAG: hypothetical protein E6Q65_06295 [Ottowia sp.]|nr:MAG: hypothetical protein E6Q65_06295 [Ottowia sp.]
MFRARRSPDGQDIGLRDAVVPCRHPARRPDTPSSSGPGRWRWRRRRAARRWRGGGRRRVRRGRRQVGRRGCATAAERASRVVRAALTLDRGTGGAWRGRRLRAAGRGRRGRALRGRRQVPGQGRGHEHGGGSAGQHALRHGIAFPSLNTRPVCRLLGLQTRSPMLEL